MLFSSVTFLFAFLPLCLGIYYIVAEKYRNPVLFLFSLIFYAWGEPVYIILMLISITVNYFLGSYIDDFREQNQPKMAKGILIICILFNLLFLGFFKYAGFVSESVNQLLHTEVLPVLNLPLPIGISFYTFQAMSYVIDVYRGEVKAQKSIIKFGTYVALFPQLIAGPIVRYKDVEKQMNHRECTIDKFGRGVQRFIIGLGKKVLIANQLGELFADISAKNSADLSVMSSWIGIIAFALQIYFDFSGYSDMAIGLGRMLGFELLENFKYPYLSGSITEFFRRWHISLGSWFRDYVYIPLGGNRKGRIRTGCNLLIVWLLTGLWHGASWNFVLWGGYFGMLLLIEKSGLLKILKKLPRFISHIYALFTVLIGWVFFSFTSLKDIAQYLKTMFGLNGAFADTQALYYLENYGVLLGIGMVASVPVGVILHNLIGKRIKKKGKWFYEVVCVPVWLLAVLLVSTAYLLSNSYNPFLYFRF